MICPPKKKEGQKQSLHTCAVMFHRPAGDSMVMVVSLCRRVGMGNGDKGCHNPAPARAGSHFALPGREPVPAVPGVGERYYSAPDCPEHSSRHSWWTTATPTRRSSSSTRSRTTSSTRTRSSGGCSSCATRRICAPPKPQRQKQPQPQPQPERIPQLRQSGALSKLPPTLI